MELSKKPSIAPNGAMLGFAHCFTDLLSLIEYVRVNEDKEIEVRLMHGDRFASIVDFLSEQKEKEAAKRIIHLTREAV